MKIFNENTEDACYFRYQFINSSGLIQVMAIRLKFLFLFYFLRASYGKKSICKIIQIIQFLFYYSNLGYTARAA